MRSHLSVLLFSLLAISGLALTANGVAYATTGHALIAGAVNTSSKRTDIKMSTSGAALALKVASGSPPLYVSSAAKVDRLNADEVDGLDSTQLRTHSYAYVFADGQKQHVGEVSLKFPKLATGSYLVSWTTSLAAKTTPTPTNPDYFFCYITSATALRGAGDSSTLVSGYVAMMSGADTLTVTSKQAPVMNCQLTRQSSWDFDSEMRVSFTKTSVTDEPEPTTTP